MACFERASLALKEILLKLHHTEKPMEIDHHLYEFGAVEYHIQSSASDPHDTYLSIATPLLSQGVLPSHGLSHHTLEMIKRICSDVLEIVEPAREGYQLTLRLDLAKVPQGKDGAKVIAQISSLQAVILSSQLKDMLQNINSQDTSKGMYKPIKLVYHPREPFFVIRQPQKITAVFPMRFRENSDVIIATAFFQELMDVGSSEAWAKAPPCTWSPIPPPELRGELFEDLSTNGGFVSFDIYSRHVEGKRLDKTVWSLLNIYAYVKYHVKRFHTKEDEKPFGKFSKGILRLNQFLNIAKMNKSRWTVGAAIEKTTDFKFCNEQVLQNASMEEEEHIQKVGGCRCVRKLVSFSRSKVLNRRCGHFTRKIPSPIKIHGFSRIRQQWLAMPKFSLTKYAKVD